MEESDNRMVLHVKDNILLQDNKKLVIRSSDSDVVIIMISFMTQFIDYSDDVSVKIDFGSRPYRRFIDVNACYDHVGESIALALPFSMPCRAVTAPHHSTEGVKLTYSIRG